MTLNAIQIILVLLVSFLAGVEGILDQFHFHQPVIACTLIGLVTGQLTPCIILGGTLEMIALGWANIGAAVAPDAALASIASAIILVLGGQGEKGVSTAIAIAVPLAVAGLLLTILVRTITTAIVHIMDKDAETASFHKIEMWQYAATILQGLRIMIPAALILAVGSGPVKAFLNMMPTWLSDGLGIGGGMVVAVGYAMVINMMATKEVWPFFAIGFVLATVKDFTLLGLGAMGLAMALIYLALSKVGGNGSGSSKGGNGGGTGDPVGDIIDNY